MTTREHIVLSLLLAVASPNVVRGQVAETLFLDPDGVTVMGTVLDVTTKSGLAAAEVRLVALDPDRTIAWRSLTDSLGSFRTPRLVTGEYEVAVSALGYSTASASVALTGYGALDLQVELVPEAVRLDPIIVTATRPSRLESSGFYGRRDRGVGRSITHTEMEARGLRRIESVFRSMGGVTIQPGRDGTSSLRMRGGCRPEIVLDGVRLGPVYRIEDVLSVDSGEGIEGFGPGSAPPQYSRSNCGTILAWSREPGIDASGRPFSWGRLGAALGFVALVVLFSY
jgi:hypothetical protein